MYNFRLHQQLQDTLPADIETGGKDNAFYTRFSANLSAIDFLYRELYAADPAGTETFTSLLGTLTRAYRQRSEVFRRKDQEKLGLSHWFLNNRLCGMSLYVDRFAGDLRGLRGKLDYFQSLGITLLHLMPVFDSPPEASDGGYAVSDFRKVNAVFGSMEDLVALQEEMQERHMFLMLDIVLNHTSDQHAWALRAKAGDAEAKALYYFYADRTVPDRFDQSMPEIFPEAAPGNFTFVPETGEWVMTVFHRYQWDLNYSNPQLLVRMIDTVLFYANLGVDILRIDAPAFIWKKIGTTSQNLPEAHTLLRLIRQCVEVVAPGMALLGEAIVAPQDIIPYFGSAAFRGRECDVAYNATLMALQWDALATGEVSLMLASQQEILQKPFGTTWITYTRCHDDIGFGFTDAAIEQAGFNAFRHRHFLQRYFSGDYPASPARGALFSVNPRTGDARISGTLASLCGLEEAGAGNDREKIQTAVARIWLMQAMSFFIGGIPMLFAGDETGAMNDYSYLEDPGKSYDNRWMHRPGMDWTQPVSPVSTLIFDGTKKLLALRRALPVVADHGNLEWLDTQNRHVAGFGRAMGCDALYCLFNFSENETSVSWYILNRRLRPGDQLTDGWSGIRYVVGPDSEPLFLAPFQFLLLSTPVPAV